VLKTGASPPWVLDDTAIDVSGVASSLTPVSAAGWVSDEGLAELAEACTFFFEPGLQLIELFEVRRCPPIGADAASRAPGSVPGVGLGGGVASLA